jgi:hypothetical protein
VEEVSEAEVAAESGPSPKEFSADTWCVSFRAKQGQLKRGTQCAVNPITASQNIACRRSTTAATLRMTTPRTIEPEQDPMSTELEG